VAGHVQRMCPAPIPPPGELAPYSEKSKTGEERRHRRKKNLGSHEESGRCVLRGVAGCAKCCSRANLFRTARFSGCGRGKFQRGWVPASRSNHTSI